MSNSTAFLSPCDRLEILRRIECVCLALRAQSKKKIPFLIEIDHPLTHNTRIFTSNSNRNVTVAHILRVLSAVYKIVLQQTNTTLRALYYQNRDLFLTQSISNLTVSLCSQLLRVRRPLLLIFATGKGVVWGPIQLLDNTSKVMGSAYTTRAPHGLRISDSISFVRGLSFRPAMGTTITTISDIQFILVVEKESAFNKIVEEIMHQHKLGRPVTPFVMISGNGMPSLAARELVRKLRARLMVPVFGMFDCNPDGIGIMLTYLHTSNASINSLGWLSNRSDYTVSEINWLGIGINHVELEAQHRGLHAKDIEKIASGRHSNRDASRFNSLKDHPMVENNIAMKMELNKMEHSAVKFEIDQISYTTLLDLIEDGVQQQMYTVVR
jgi:meiotic recombination protein SPO11